MANPISGDSFPAQTARKERNLDARDKNTGSPLAGSSVAAKTADRTDVDRAYQRLSQESGEPTATTISTAMQARETLARLRALMQGDAQTALRAHGGIRTDFFEAAIAQPTI